MEFIRTIREKSQTKRYASIVEEAERLITLDDFDDSLFIAYNGVPFVPIEKQWATKEIVEKLSELRHNYANARLKECGLGQLAIS
jgi:hypothetical protein